ncbi:hypothetical protein [Vibrio owensii]|uniref:hypothetical protein n=1 Tax=Vibrio harveyi group TaxID=717610 RepID=UPI003CC52A56
MMKKLVSALLIAAFSLPAMAAFKVVINTNPSAASENGGGGSTGPGTPTVDHQRITDWVIVDTRQRKNTNAEILAMFTAQPVEKVKASFEPEYVNSPHTLYTYLHGTTAQVQYIVTEANFYEREVYDVYTDGTEVYVETQEKYEDDPSTMSTTFETHDMADDAVVTVSGIFELKMTNNGSSISLSYPDLSSGEAVQVDVTVATKSDAISLLNSKGVYIIDTMAVMDSTTYYTYLFIV